MKNKSAGRNQYAIAMNKKAKGGKMRSKKDKRKNGKNKVKAYLNEDY